MVGNGDDKTAALLLSWQANAANWTKAVREELIASRRDVTNEAILDLVRSLNPDRVLDVGCGEGWLVRELRTRLDCEVEGFDGSMELIEAAQEHDPAGRYTVLTYEALNENPDTLGWQGNLAVCNFSLLSEDLTPLLLAIRRSLEPGGQLVIQTLHSWSAAGDSGYQDGWREDDFRNLPDGDWAPMTWYFRTLSSWVRNLNAADFRIVDILEPRHPETGKAVSMIFHCRS